jgi:hypothetical protein
MMNEQIRELAKDADIDWHRYWNDDGSNRLQIFAELIVRKCCDVLYDNEMGGYRVDHVLKEHFGIE